MTRIDYYDNNETHGMIIDWDRVYNEYLSLNVPFEYDYITGCPMDFAKYIMLLSERSIGKTTSVLLFGMCANKLYGTIIQYVRSIQDMTAPVNADQKFKTIRGYMRGRYIKDLTDGKYNAIIYYERKWYYTVTDENGKEIRDRRAAEHFMQELSIDRNDLYASSYNAPEGDIIIFDEFIQHNGRYYPNEFVHFLDLLKTVIRDRYTPIVFMLANTINPYHTYFREFEIHKQVREMRVGSEARIITNKGTKIYIALLKSKKTSYRKEKINSMFWGFENPELAAITGGDWALEYAPHIQHDEGEEVLDRTTYIDYAGEYIQLELVRSDNIGLHIQAHFATKTHDDSWIYTDIPEKQTDSRYHFGMNNRNRKRDKLLRTLMEQGLIFYDTNNTQTMLKAFLADTKQ